MANSPNTTLISVAADWNCVDLGCCPSCSAMPPFFMALRKSEKYNVSAGTEDGSNVENRDKVNRPGRERALHASPGNCLRLRPAVPCQPRHRHLPVRLVKPEGKRIRLVGVVRKHEEPKGTPTTVMIALMRKSQRHPASPLRPSMELMMAACRAPDIMLPTAWQEW